jgi:diadenosine tetraphosphatase ApaH/serine/threonine PP2A family protein phosphatase
MCARYFLTRSDLQKPARRTAQFHRSSRYSPGWDPGGYEYRRCRNSGGRTVLTCIEDNIRFVATDTDKGLAAAIKEGRYCVRYGVISDIHSNLVAFERTLEVLAERAIDRYVCLGDVVGYGARPNECCELLRSLDVVSVVGNHDVAACVPGGERWFTPAARSCILWTRDVLTPANREYLKSLPVTTEIDGAHLCHASLADPDAYISSPLETLPSFAMMKQPLCLFGHTHYAEWFHRVADAGIPHQHTVPGGGTVVLERGHTYMINPGSVGQPRDGNSQASFAVIDTDEGIVTIERVSYDIKVTQQQIIEAGLPKAMAQRLLSGM